MIRIKDVKEIYPQEMTNGEIYVYLSLQDDKKFCLAVPSWHVDIDGLISYPAIHDHRENWLADLGYEVPLSNDYSRELKERLSSILEDNEDDIISHLDSEAGIDDKTFWSNLWPVAAQEVQNG